MVYIIRVIMLGWNGWNKYCPFERITASHVHQVMDLIDETEDLYLGKDPVWMVAIYIDVKQPPIALKTAFGWQVPA